MTTAICKSNCSLGRGAQRRPRKRQTSIAATVSGCLGLAMVSTCARAEWELKSETNPFDKTSTVEMATRSIQGLPVIVSLGCTLHGYTALTVVTEKYYQAPKEAEIPASFPAKLLSLLLARFQSGGEAILILPCELVSENGKVLRQILVRLAAQWQLGQAFSLWMESRVTICDTLVDRIVSEALDPIGAIAEPYALWAIKRDPFYEIPFTHPAVVVTDDLEPYLRLKLHILNLGHSFLAEIWQSEARPRGETVREILSDPIIKDRLMQLYQTEIIPGFAGHNMAEAATKYVATTLGRFENPFLNHRLSDIAQNHHLKIDRRAVDFVTWVKQANPSANIAMLQALIDGAERRRV